jgi:hypothetical protein
MYRIFCGVTINTKKRLSALKILMLTAVEIGTNFVFFAIIRVEAVTGIFYLFTYIHGYKVRACVTPR